MKAFIKKSDPDLVESKYPSLHLNFLSSDLCVWISCSVKFREDLCILQGYLKVLISSNAHNGLKCEVCNTKYCYKIGQYLTNIYVHC